MEDGQVHPISLQELQIFVPGFRLQDKYYTGSIVKLDL